MSKAISKEEAAERLLHHLRGHVLEVMIKGHTEPHMLSLYLKAVTSKLHRQIAEVLDAYKPPAEPTPAPQPPPTTKK